MENSASAVLLVCKTWNTGIHEPTTIPTRILIQKFCEETQTSASHFYCSVLDETVSEEQIEYAENVGVTLITATRSKWSDPKEDQPGVHWFVSHSIYYPNLKSLKDIQHVVSFTFETKNAAAAVHDSLFPDAHLHLLTLTRPSGVLFTFDVWNKYACGLTGYHRAVIKEFCTRKAKAGEHLKAYSTVLDSELSDEQKEDAEKCGVTLIPAQSEPGGYTGTQLSGTNRFINHADYLTNLKNIQYVVGYAPKTGFDAAYIRKKFFPGAKLALINHAFPEKNYLNGGFEDLEDQMLKMTSEADLLFSIGPRIYEYFENAYRADVDGRKLSDIPHDEILPPVKQEYVDHEFKVDPGMKAYSLLTYGQLDTQKALERCKSMAASIGTAANKQAGIGKVPEWKIHGVSENVDEITVESLNDKVQSGHVQIKLYKSYSTKVLLRHLQQSHLCIPPSCYEDYSFEGFEAMASGLPTTVCDDSHIASLITKYFEEHEDYCVVEADKLSSKITDKLHKISKGFKQAKLLKRSLVESEAIQESLANFTAMLKRDGILTSTFTKINEETVQMEGQNDKTAAQTDTIDTVAKHAKSSEREGQRSRKRAVVDHEKLVTQQYAGAEQVQPKVQRIESTKQGPPFEVGPAREQNSGNNNIEVNVSLNEGYRQEKAHLDRQPQTISDMELKSSLERFTEELNKIVEQLIANCNSTREVNHIISTIIGNVTACSMKNKSLGISLSIPTLYNLNRLKQTCRSGSFPNSFEPLLITNKMRQEADKVGLQLTLKATYDQTRFDDLRLFFINRDGGGLGPVKVLQDIIEPEDGEEILILPNITGSVESADVLHDDSSEEEKHQQFKDKKALEGKQCEPEPEKAILESQLDGAKREKAVLEERCKELTEKLESTEKVMVSQRVKNREKREKMQFQLEEQERLIKELQNKPGESGQKLEQPDLQKEEEKGVEKTEETVDVERVKSPKADSSIMQPIKESAVTGGVPRSTVEAVTNISSKAEKTGPVPGIVQKPEVVSTEDSGLQKKTKDLDVWKSDHGSKVSEETADSDISKKYAKSETSRYDERLPLDDLSLVGSGTVDESVTDQKQTERGVTKSEQSTTATTIERTRENTKVAESNKAVTKVHDTVGYIARVTDGKKVTAMEGPMTRELTSRDSKLTGTKDTKDIFSRDTATDKDIGGKDGRKGISEAFGSSIDTRDSKVKEKKTFTRRMSSAMQKLVSKFTISEKRKELRAADEKLDSRFTIPEKKEDSSARDEKLDSRSTIPEKKEELSAVDKKLDSRFTIPEKKEDFSAVDEGGNTYLHTAARSGDIDKVNAAIKAGVDLECKNKDGDTAIILAALRKHVDVVKCLIDAGANVNASGQREFTALHCAAQEGHADLVKILINATANLEAVTEDEATALHYTAQNGHKDVAEILIGAKANIEALSQQNATPLILAAENGHTDVVRILIDAGANIEAHQDGFTPLHMAAQEGHKDVADILIGAKANIEALTKKGFTPLHMAAQNGHKDVADILIGAKANIEALTKEGFTSLHYAAQNGHKDVAEILIGAKANIEALTKDNSMPVHIAAGEGHLDIVKYFIKTLGIDKDVKGQDNKTPLISAAEGGRSEVVKYLLGIGADIEAVTSTKDTPLTWAAYHGHPDVVRILIDAGANKEACDEDGKTALRLALDKGHTEVAKLL